MKRLQFRPAGLVTVLLAAASAHAGTIYESAAMGATGNLGGYVVDSEQWLGSRFELTQAYDISAVGGHFGSRGGANWTIFAEIVQLSGPLALPSDPPNSISPLAVTVFAIPANSGSSLDFRTPLALTLGPGNYALIFGSGLFGATGSAKMPFDNSDIVLATDSSFQANPLNNTWSNGFLYGARFVVEGDVSAPEPSTAILLFAALVSLGRTVIVHSFLSRRPN